MNRPVHGIRWLLLPALAGAMLLASAALPPKAWPIAHSTAYTAEPRDRNLIKLRRNPVNTRNRRALDSAALDLHQQIDPLTASAAPETERLRIIQFTGPMRRPWIERLKATGAQIVCFVPNNACVIRGSASEIAGAAALDGLGDADDSRPVQWMGRLEPVQKIDPVFGDEAIERGRQEVAVEIEVIDSQNAPAALEVILNVASVVNREPRRFLNFIVVAVTLPVGRLIEVARNESVLFIGPASEQVLQDERASQIVAGNVTPDGTQPTGPGYLNWLTSIGLNTRSDFVIDVADTGMDRGSIADSLVHPDFRDSQGHSRVAYNLNYANDGQLDDRPGHGSIVASVAGGLGSSERKDASGYMFGLGVDPGVLLGASRIFDHLGRQPTRLSFTSVASAAYDGGARISNNSWGDGGNVYDAAAQEYDSLVRDAQPLVAGNQEMTFVFAVGNGGPGGHVSSPGTAKNVITVAASENFRPEGSDSCNLDGGGPIGPDGADNALDILRYSAGGPTADGRAKPDIAAPGTHIYGAASQSSFFNGNALCPGVPLYQPPGQSLYTWSSGTSLATPQISGAAALVRRFFVARSLLEDGQAPSPAMIKAVLINSASYMAGEHAGGDLPGLRQGWGLVNLEYAFANTSRKLIDQTTLFTESGQSFEIAGALTDRSKPLRVTLAWTDAPGSLVAQEALVNDLDLEVTVGGVTVYRGNSFFGRFSVEGGRADTLNNVEAVFLSPEMIPPGAAGNFKVTVRAANISGDGVPGNDNPMDQDFALIITNIGPPIDPPPPKKPPVIASATYVGKTLTIGGHDFTAKALVEVNGQIIDRTFTFDSSTNSLSLRLKRKKLNLKADADNQIVLVENGERSQAFTLRL